MGDLIDRLLVVARSFAVLGIVAEGAHARGRLPINDMHLHAIPVDCKGPPPRTVCAAFTNFAVWDTREDYREIFVTAGDHPVIIHSVDWSG
jgi:hypothetical protein